MTCKTANPIAPTSPLRPRCVCGTITPYSECRHLVLWLPSHRTARSGDGGGIARDSTPSAAFPDRALCLPVFNHLLIVNTPPPPSSSSSASLRQFPCVPFKPLVDDVHELLRCFVMRPVSETPRGVCARKDRTRGSGRREGGREGGSVEARERAK